MKQHTLGAINDKHLFLTAPEPGDKMPVWLGSWWRLSSWFINCHRLIVFSHCKERKRATSPSVLTRTLVSSWGLLPLDLITSSSSIFPYHHIRASSYKFGGRHRDFGGIKKKPSMHSILAECYGSNVCLSSWPSKTHVLLTCKIHSFHHNSPQILFQYQL